MTTLLVPLTVALALAGAVTTEAREDCSAQSAFDRGQAGVPAASACADKDYRSAWRLGGELAALEAERRQLLAGDASGQADGPALRRVRQLSVDIEAIGAALQLRGIIQEGPRPQPAGAVGDGVDPAKDRS